jgi:hypothetical protein
LEPAPPPWVKAQGDGGADPEIMGVETFGEGKRFQLFSFQYLRNISFEIDRLLMDSRWLLTDFVDYDT